MKQLFLLLAFFVCTDLQAQNINKTTTRKAKKKTHSSRHTSRPPETYTSNKGKIKARSLGKYEDADKVDPKEKDASHINSNYNESTPPLSPSTGSSSPR